MFIDYSVFLISVEVLLRSASVSVIKENNQITSKNIHEYLPAAETVDSITRFFRQKGFEVFPLGGISLTIAGTIEQFSELFDTNIVVDEAKGVLGIHESEESSHLLPLAQLPKYIQEQIVAVTFVPPPDFGPTNFGP
jgi:subtilase family serine protease